MGMATAICSSFKQELMQGTHNLGSNTIKALLVKASSTLVSTNQTNVGTPGTGAPATTNIGTDEVSGSGYSAGGVSCTAGSVGLTGTVAYWQPGGAISFGTVTLATAFDAVVMYNSTQTGKAIAVWNFGSTTVNNGTFTINLPTNDSSNALIRLN